MRGLITKYIYVVVVGAEPKAALADYYAAMDFIWDVYRIKKSMFDEYNYITRVPVY